MAWTTRDINRFLKLGATVTANVPNVGDGVKVEKARVDMFGRIAVRVAGEDRFRNIDAETVRISDGDAVSKTMR